MCAYINSQSTIREIYHNLPDEKKFNLDEGYKPSLNNAYNHECGIFSFIVLIVLTIRM